MATVTKRGTSWFAQVRRKGFAPQYKTFRFKAEALAWARQVEGAIDEGKVPFGTLSPKGLSLRSLLDRYKAEVTPRKRSAASENLRLAKLQRDPLADTDLGSLEPNAIAAYRDRRLRIVKPATVRRELALLTHALNIASREWGYALARNPVAVVQQPTVDNARERRLRKGELEKLEVASRASRNGLVGPIVRLAIETALRRAEIINLEWRHVDLVQRTAHIPVTKSGKARTIPLTDGAVSILRHRRTEAEVQGKVFPITANALRLSWERLRRRAGLVDLRFHDLRHEAISRFCELGLTLAEVALISGHKDYRMLARYTHLQPMDLAMKLKGRAWEPGTSRQ
ncbi:site-specific integrase [Sphingomonas sp.]|uniref:site-specific integrase n=1 Tax=Sphingomonas sp. TaxID=28214 RepID=UPI0025FC2953|nr:site-specific integrase [Sphingomonas sp.]